MYLNTFRFWVYKNLHFIKIEKKCYLQNIISIAVLEKFTLTVNVDNPFITNILYK